MLWHRLVLAHGCWKTQNIICGMEGENVVAYGRLPFPRSALVQGLVIELSSGCRFKNMDMPDLGRYP